MHRHRTLKLRLRIGFTSRWFLFGVFAIVAEIQQH